MTLNERNKISDVQSQFGKAFPYLRIEFYDVPNNQPYTLTAKSKTFNSERELRFCSRKQDNDILKGGPIRVKLDPALTVVELESELWEKFGLWAKIFRKSGNSWIATSLTRSWTLGQQNDEGEQMSAQIPRSENLDMADRDQSD